MHFKFIVITLEKIPFLDSQVKIKNSKIITDLYKKATDRNMYLLPSCCHVATVCENIPFSLCLRINRICPEPEARDRRFAELKTLLLSREYRPGVINSAIERAKAIPGKKLSKELSRNKHQTGQCLL